VSHSLQQRKAIAQEIVETKKKSLQTLDKLERIFKETMAQPDRR
jgi:hypothetical protein